MIRWETSMVEKYIVTIRMQPLGYHNGKQRRSCVMKSMAYTRQSDSDLHTKLPLRRCNLHHRRLVHALLARKTSPLSFCAHTTEHSWIDRHRVAKNRPPTQSFRWSTTPYRLQRHRHTGDMQRWSMTSPHHAHRCCAHHASIQICKLWCSHTNGKSCDVETRWSTNARYFCL